MESAHKLFSTRGGTLFMAGLAAVLATVAVLVYLSHYRSSVKASGVPATVLVAKQLIHKGTPGAAVAREHLFQATTIRESQLRNGAISDAATLSGRVAANDIYPGQQLTADDFVVTSNTLASRLAGTERAITLPIDAAHGLIGHVETADRVDVYAGFNVTPIDSAGRPSGGTGRAVLRLIVPNVSVLAVGNSSSGSSGQSSITLDVNPRQAANLAFASDNGKVWVVLRPASGAKPTPPKLVTVETLLLGIPPVAALKSFGGR
jgi:pilus assembly protein CpaB